MIHNDNHGCFVEAAIYLHAFVKNTVCTISQNECCLAYTEWWIWVPWFFILTSKQKIEKKTVGEIWIN